MPATALVPVESPGAAGVVLYGTGTTEVAADTGNGNSFPNRDHSKSYLLVRNSGVGARNVTITTPGTVDGLAIADRTVAVGNAVTKIIGPFDATIYGDTVVATGDHAELKFTAFHIS